MTGVLLDTCAILDVFFAPHLLGQNTIAVLTKGDVDIYFSPESIYEITYKARKNIPGFPPVDIDYVAQCKASHMKELAVTAEPMAQAGLLDWAHRDPFDRKLVCQARHAGFGFMTRDRVILDAGPALGLTVQDTRH